MNYNRIAHYLTGHNQPEFRLTQLAAACKKGAHSWAEIKGWPENLKNDVGHIYSFNSFSDSTVLTSVDGTKKATLTLQDGAVIETVLMQPKPNLYSVCVSSEVGCPMGCAFCATGKMGFKRVLTSEEITDQWLFWLQLLKHEAFEPTHLVFMGMGEPFHNQANVFAAISTFHEVYGLGWRKMSISTCGLIPGIADLAAKYPQVNLAISLHAATEDKRTRLMPINKAYSLEALQSELQAYLKTTKRQLMFEYILLDRINDQPEDMSALLSWLKPFPQHLIHINLIRYNPTGTEFSQPEKSIVHAWKQFLENHGVLVSIRKNLGTDIFGACGQLATKPVVFPELPISQKP